MRYLDQAAIEHIAIGAAFLGTGGEETLYWKINGTFCYRKMAL